MLLKELTWTDVDALNRDTPVIIPVAALEQHGHHMPVFTDSMLLGEITERAHEQVKDRVLMTPLMWLGNSDHHMDFPGTMSAAPRVYLDLLNGLIENFITHEFRRIVMVNGHGGNDVPGKQATFELRQKYRDRSDLLLLFATYWNLAEPTADTIADLQQTEMGHACEWETSMILRLAPHLVRDHQQIPTVEPGNPFHPASRAWIMPDRSVPGHVGNASAATAEKGEQLFQAFTAGVVDLLHRVIQWDGTSWEG